MDRGKSQSWQLQTMFEILAFLRYHFGQILPFCKMVHKDTSWCATLFHEKSKKAYSKRDTSSCLYHFTNIANFDIIYLLAQERLSPPTHYCHPCYFTILGCVKLAEIGYIVNKLIIFNFVRTSNVWNLEINMTWW